MKKTMNITDEWNHFFISTCSTGSSWRSPKREMELLFLRGAQAMLNALMDYGRKAKTAGEIGSFADRQFDLIVKRSHELLSMDDFQ